MDPRKYTMEQHRAATIVDQLTPLILSETGVPVRPDFYERLVLRLAELNSTPLLDMAVKRAKVLVIKNRDYACNAGLRDLLAALGYEKPRCQCYGPPHAFPCPCFFWENPDAGAQGLGGGIPV